MGGGGWGGQKFFAFCGRFVCIWTWVLGPNSRYPQSDPPIWPLAGEDLAVFTPDRLHLQDFQNSTFSETLLSPLGWVWVMI